MTEKSVTFVEGLAATNISLTRRLENIHALLVLIRGELASGNHQQKCVCWRCEMRYLYIDPAIEECGMQR